MFGKTYRQMEWEAAQRRRLWKGIGCGLLIVAGGVGFVALIGYAAIKVFGG